MSHDPLETAPSQKTAGIRLVLVRPANDEQWVVVSYKFYEVVVEGRANALPPVNGVNVEVDPVLGPASWTTRVHSTGPTRPLSRCTPSQNAGTGTVGRAFGRDASIRRW
jgi:hypothetical protein